MDTNVSHIKETASELDSPAVAAQPVKKHLQPYGGYYAVSPSTIRN